MSSWSTCLVVETRYKQQTLTAICIRPREQRFECHTDRLTNYIRYWQADGESQKTSIRTKTALGPAAAVAAEHIAGEHRLSAGVPGQGALLVVLIKLPT